MDGFFQDLRFALRSTYRGGFLPWVAIACLAIGIGINTAMFSIVHGVLYRDLPFRDPASVVAVTARSESRGLDDAQLTFADLEDLRASGVFTGVEGLQGLSFTLTGAETPERAQGSGVTPGLFALLGVEPQLGRGFLPDEGAPPGFAEVVLLSDALWRRHFGGDPDVLGRTLVVNGRPLVVVGVMPAGFRFPETDDLWVPVAPTGVGARSARPVAAVARLEPGRELGAARDALSGLSARLAALFPESHRDWEFVIRPLRDTVVDAPARRAFHLLLGAVGFVLLIACANVANLLLARASDREREVAVRAALGASRARVVRQFLTEALVLSLTGAAGGWLLALWAIDANVSRIPEDLAYWIDVGPDGVVLLYTLALSVVTAVLFGSLPALRASRLDLARRIGDRGSVGAGRGRLREGLIALEISLSLVLLVGAALMVESFLRMSVADPGFRTDNVLTMRLVLAGDRYDPAAAKADFFQTAAERLRDLEGVEGAVALSSIPADDGGLALPVRAGRETPLEQAPVAIMVGATAGAFAALGLEPLAGRDLLPSEVRDTTARVALVGASLARLLWGDADPLGRTLIADQATELRVVGVVPDLQYEEFGEETAVSRLQLYVPPSLRGWRGMAFLVRTRGEPASVAAAARNTLAGLDAALAPFEVMTMQERRRLTTWPQRFFGTLFAQFGGVALLLAVAGVYGVMAYAVSVRRREIGVRMVFGASARSVMREMMRRSLLPAVVGLALGLVGALGVSRLLGGLLYGVEGTDPATYLLAALALALAAGLATWLPARRVLRLQASEALREG